MKKVTSQFPGKRVLVADDYFINQEVAQNILELMEIEVDLAENGREAIQKHQSYDYDLILMDIQMPEIDGFEATKAIRAFEGEKKHTPIIALTASAISGDREHCIAAGMDDYISKPVETDKLEALLNKYFQQK